MFGGGPINMVGAQAGPPSFSAWPMPGPGYSFASPMTPASVPVTAEGFNQPSGASWESDVPVMANSRVAPSPYAQYLEAGDLVLALDAVPESRDAVRLAKEEMVQALNVAAANDWLRKQCAQCNDWLDKNLPAGDPLRTASEFVFDAALADPASFFGQQSPSVRALLAYRTGHGIMSRLRLLGPNMTQSNMVTSTDLIGGSSLSADHGDTQVAWVVRGSAKTRNIWGPLATVGRHLWLALRRTDDDVFQLETYMNKNFGDVVDQAALMYAGRDGRLERAACYYVGRVSVRGRVTARDAFALKRAIDGSNLGEAHKLASMLELFDITVAPRRHGTYMTLY